MKDLTDSFECIKHRFQWAVCVCQNMIRWYLHYAYPSSMNFYLSIIHLSIMWIFYFSVFISYSDGLFFWRILTAPKWNLIVFFLFILWNLWKIDFWTVDEILYLNDWWMTSKVWIFNGILGCLGALRLLIINYSNPLNLL